MKERSEGNPRVDPRAAHQAEYITTYFDSSKRRSLRARLGDRYNPYALLVRRYITDFWDKPISYRGEHPEIEDALKEEATAGGLATEWKGLQRTAKNIYATWVNSYSTRRPVTRQGRDPQAYLGDESNRRGGGRH